MFGPMSALLGSFPIRFPMSTESSVFKLKALKGDLSVTATCGHLTHIQQKKLFIKSEWGDFILLLIWVKVTSQFS